MPVPATSDCFFQADISVVPPGGQSFFYSGARATVPGCGPPTTIAGDIDLCSAAGSATSTEVAAGTLAASGPQTVASQANPLAPTHVPPGPYTMTATAPAGYVFVTCGGPATVASTGVTASETVAVPGGGAESGIFYVVVANPVGSLNGSGPPSGSVNGSTSPAPASSPGNPTPAAVLAQRNKPATTPVGSSHLAFTGFNTGPLLLSGLLALAFGVLATSVARRRAGRRPAHARR